MPYDHHSSIFFSIIYFFLFSSDILQEEITKKTGYIVMREDGTFDVDANTSIDQLSEELNVKIPEVCSIVFW